MTTTTQPALRHGPALPLELKAAAGGGAGGGMEVEGYASAWSVDLGGDQVERGAYRAWLQSGQTTRFLFSHHPDQPLGKILSMKEDSHGLHVRAKISDTQLGRDIHTLLQDEALDSFSIGYIVRDAEQQNGVRRLLQLDLPEISLVSMPMQPDARVSSVKARLPGARGPLRLSLDQERARIARRAHRAQLEAGLIATR